MSELDDGRDSEHGSKAGASGLAHALFGTHTHEPSEIDQALTTSQEGIRAVKLALVGLLITAVLQVFVVAISGSVALLSDTVHNFADALTALPLWLAFSVAHRAPTRRYTYGYGRAEDLAGIFIVLVIAASAAFAAYETIDRLISPVDLRNLPFVMAASVLGFAGNELVAVYRIRVGKKIGSAALVADGFHARVDGLTSLAVLAGAIGVALGFEAADPIAGLVIIVAILAILRSAALDIYHRLMDAVDPALVDHVEKALVEVEGVAAVDQIHLRWIGHQLRAEVEIAVDESLNVIEAHDVAVAAHHHLLHEVPRLTSAIVHASPLSVEGIDHHEPLNHHRLPHQL